MGQAVWLPKEKLLPGAPWGTLPAQGQESGTSASLPAHGMGRSLDAVEDFALHAVLDLPPPHHQLQHLVDGMLWVFLEKERAREDEPAGKVHQHPQDAAV